MKNELGSVLFATDPSVCCRNFKIDDIVNELNVSFWVCSSVFNLSNLENPKN